MMATSGLRKSIPWWLRLGSKIILARLPFPYVFWKRLGLFEHGDMNLPSRALNTFLEHAQSAGVLDTSGELARLKHNAEDFNVLELGPGDSLFTAVIARSLGASRTWLVDAGRFATTDISAYVGLLNFLQQKGFPLSFDGAPRTLAEVLGKYNGKYLTQGVQSLKHLPSSSVDYCFSNAVLEHIQKIDFIKMVDELLRILKPGGVCHHRVDLKDHLGGCLNNLRFSDATWEGELFRNSGFYTNRIRFNEMIGIFEQAGFKCSLPRVVRWDKLPTPLAKLDVAFQQVPVEDLLVSGFDVVLKHKG